MSFEWIEQPLIEQDSSRSPVRVRSQAVERRRRCPSISYPWHQWICATQGTLTVMVDRTWYVVPPKQALWLPAGTLYTLATMDGAEFTCISIEATVEVSLPSGCTMYRVSSLLLELLVEADHIRQSKEVSSYVGLLQRIIVEQLHRQTEQNFQLPWPTHERLLTICQQVYLHPDDGRTLDEWAVLLGISSRTLTRLFSEEMGISFRAWRYRLRLCRALEWLCHERPVTEIAQELGYANPSAFAYMFKESMGCTPSEWRSPSR